MKTTIENNEEIIARAFTLGMNYERTITGCCQCTIAAIQDALGLKDDAVFKAGSGLTAGGGLSCEGSCGGYTGDNMARALLNRFNREYGSNICRVIHGRIFGRTFDLGNAPEREIFETMGAHFDKCTTVVGKAAAWSTELILDELSNRGMSLHDLQSIKGRQWTMS
jgi:hypothetical protein